MIHPLSLHHFSVSKDSSNAEQKALLTARTQNIYELMQKAGFHNREILGVASELLGCVTQQLKNLGEGGQLLRGGEREVSKEAKTNCDGQKTN